MWDWLEIEPATIKINRKIKIQRRTLKMNLEDQLWILNKLTSQERHIRRKLRAETHRTKRAVETFCDGKKRWKWFQDLPSFWGVYYTFRDTGKFWTKVCATNSNIEKPFSRLGLAKYGHYSNCGFVTEYFGMPLRLAIIDFCYAKSHVILLVLW